MTEIGIGLVLVAALGMFWGRRRSAVFKWGFSVVLILGLALIVTSLITFPNMPD